jgi:hypothetical protein
VYCAPGLEDECERDDLRVPTSRREEEKEQEAATAAARVIVK